MYCLKNEMPLEGLHTKQERFKKKKKHSLLARFLATATVEPQHCFSLDPLQALRLNLCPMLEPTFILQVISCWLSVTLL